MSTKTFARIAVNAAGVVTAATALSVPFRVILMGFEPSDTQCGASLALGYVAFCIFAIGNVAVSELGKPPHDQSPT